MIKTILLLATITFSLNAFSQDSEKDKIEESKVYTESEFKTKLDKLFAEKLNSEIEKTLKRIKPDSLSALTREILEKEKILKHSKSQLGMREEQLKLNEKLLTKKIINFDKRQKKLIACFDKNDQEKASRINKMVEVISGMRPANAASVLSVQDSSISVVILSRLEPAKASKIFNLMDKEISARLQKLYLNMKK
ncbi:MAG: hypothetical protein HOE90_18930 [Bacteriovoracaceae bacterium]|jgi:flagellar motility protein MotE (MotC chaperone)|nr:hypothetical protein [Bacteriovoracaceae bacterium]